MLLTSNKSTSGGVESLTGAINDINTIFTVSNTSLYITIQGQVLYENIGYTRAGLTLTLTDAPVTGNVARSHY